MILRFNSEQFGRFDTLARSEFERELCDFIAAHYTAPRHQTIAALVRRNLGDCATLSITSEHALYAYNILCFQLDQPLCEDEEFCRLYKDYMRRFRTADQLPIDLLEVCS